MAVSSRELQVTQITRIPKDLKTSSHLHIVSMKVISVLIMFMLCISLLACSAEHNHKQSTDQPQTRRESISGPPTNHTTIHTRVFYVWANDELVASIDQDGNKQYYHNDPWDNTQVITDSKGNVVWRKQKS